MHCICKFFFSHHTVNSTISFLSFLSLLLCFYFKKKSSVFWSSLLHFTELYLSEICRNILTVYLFFFFFSVYSKNFSSLLCRIFARSLITLLNIYFSCVFYDWLAWIKGCYCSWLCNQLVFSMIFFF